MCPKFFGASCIRISIKNCYRKGQGVEELINNVSSYTLLLDKYHNAHGKFYQVELQLIAYSHMLYVCNCPWQQTFQKGFDAPPQDRWIINLIGFGFYFFCWFVINNCKKLWGHPYITKLGRGRIIKSTFDVILVGQSVNYLYLQK